MNDNDVKLTKAEKFFNACNAGAKPVVLLATIQWIINTWIAQWHYARRKGRPFKPQFPHELCVSVTGGQPQMIIEDLRAWGVSCQHTDSHTVVENNAKFLEMRFLVAAQQWEFADAILFQNQGDYIVTSAPGSKRGATFWQPWGVGAKARSFDESINGAIAGIFKSERKTVRLGKTYKAR